MALQELMDVIGFDEEDLDANRHGYMSKKQRVALRHEAGYFYLAFIKWRSLLPILPITLAVFGYTYLSLYTNAATYQRLSPDTFDPRYYLTLALVLPILIGVLFLIVGLIGGFMRRRQTERDLLKGNVSLINGNIHLDHDERETHGLFRRKYSIRVVNKLVINGVSFNPSGKVWQAFSNNRYENYRIYYAPHTMTILSAEFIDHS